MFATLFAIDPRSLAALRIGSGVLFAIDLLARFPLIPWLYSDAGVLPRSALSGALPTPAFWSGGASYEGALHVALLGACALLIAGRAARAASFVCWIGLLSLIARHPGVSNAGDLILSQLLFWSALLPIADRASLRRAARQVPAGAQVLSPASAGLVLLMPGIYFSSAFHKIAGAGWLEGTIIHYTVLNDTWSTAFGRFLAAIPGATAGLTWGTLVLELIGPLLLFSPIATARLRILTVLAFFGLQAGIGLSIELWLFPFISSLALVPLLPGCFWDRLGPSERASVPERAFVSGWTRRRPATAAAVVGALALALFAGSHIQSQLPKPPEGQRPALGPLTRTARQLGLRQNWVMYSAERTWNERLLVRNEDAAGRRSWIDDAGENASWPPIAALRESYRGRRLFVRLEYHRRPIELRSFADWVCRTRKAEPGFTPGRIGLVSWRQPIDAAGGPDGIERRMLLEHPCR